MTDKPVIYKSFMARNNNVNLLHYELQKAIKALQRKLTKHLPKHYDLHVFEGYRSKARQWHLYEQGRSKPGSIVTNARGGESWHQYGLAADIVLRHKTEGVWDWSFTEFYDKLVETAPTCGLELGPSWDKCHVQLTAGLTIKQAFRLAESFDILTLWHRVDENLKAKD